MSQRTVRTTYVDSTTGVLRIGFVNGGPEQLTGVQVLLERVAKLLTTKIGSNLFSPTLGSPIGNKQAITTNADMQLQILIGSAVEGVATQIQTEQTASDVTLGPEQKLLSLEVSNIVKGTDPSTWYVEVLVITSTNEAYFLTV